MTDPRRRATCLALLAILVMAPAAGRAHEVEEIECFGNTAANGLGTCTETFHFHESTAVSFARTHAHFHALVPEIGPSKYVSMQWIDARGRPIYTTHCQDRGLSTHALLGDNVPGPSDAQNITCSNVYHRTTYAGGEQRIVVTATATGDPTPGDTFHGRLHFIPDGAIY